MAGGQITQWMKDGGFDMDAFMEKANKSPMTRSPLEHILRALQPATDTVIGGANVVKDAAKAVVAPGMDTLRRGVYSAVGMEPNDPNKGAKQAGADLAESTRKLAAPTRNGLNSVQSMLQNFLSDSGKLKSDPSTVPMVGGPTTEKAFQDWYGAHAKNQGLNPNPDDPNHHYDYRAAFAAGAGPGPDGHWPSKFKTSGHPRMVINGTNTKTGEPATGGITEGGGGRTTSTSLSSGVRVKGALPGTTTTAQGALSTAAPEEVAPAAAGVAATVPQTGGAGPAATPQTSLMDMFRERLAQIPKAEMDHLTDKQKNALQLQFFLGLMKHGANPDSTFAGNIGEAGLDAVHSSRLLQQQNAERGIAQQKMSIESLMQEAALGDKDRDNSLRIRAAGQQDRQLAQGDIGLGLEGQRVALQGQHMDILREQLEQGKWKETKGGGYLYDVKSKQVIRLVDQNGKPVPIEGNDKEPMEVKLLRHLRNHPEDKQLYMELNPAKGGLTQKDLLEAGLKLNTESIEPQTPQQSRKNARTLAGLAPDPQQAPPPALNLLQSNPTPENKAAFKNKYGYLPQGM